MNTDAQPATPAHRNFLGSLISHVCARIFCVWVWREETSCSELLLTPIGRALATVTHEGTWVTWTAWDTPGENGEADPGRRLSFNAQQRLAKREALAACVRQGIL